MWRRAAARIAHEYFELWPTFVAGGAVAGGFFGGVFGFKMTYNDEQPRGLYRAKNVVVGIPLGATLGAAFGGAAWAGIPFAAPTVGFFTLSEHILPGQAPPPPETRPPRD